MYVQAGPGRSRKLGAKLEARQGKVLIISAKSLPNEDHEGRATR